MNKKYKLEFIYRLRTIVTIFSPLKEWGRSPLPPSEDQKVVKCNIFEGWGVAVLPFRFQTLFMKDVLHAFYIVYYVYPGYTAYTNFTDYIV